MDLNLPSLLTPLQVKIDDLLLDPNNPRFSELGEELAPIPEMRFAEPRVQDRTLEKMKDPSFDVGELRDTIKSLGFLPMDRIVVRRWKGVMADHAEKYVVIEGNRRVTALKWLLNLHADGKETFSDAQLSNFQNLEALCLDDATAPESASLILPGLRHVSGVKEWGAYQKAKAIHALRRTGFSPQEAAQSLGLSTRAANSAYRCFLSLEQMKANEEFGDFAEPRMYSYFEEVQKRANLRNWFGWSDEHEIFTNDERINEFYSWIVPSDDENGSSPKLPESKSVRDLSQIIGDENALNILRAPEGSLTRALARYEVDHPDDWFPKIVQATGALKTLPPDTLRTMDGPTVNALQDLKERVERVLRDRETLVNAG